jgi:hypothetical protein
MGDPSESNDELEWLLQPLNWPISAPARIKLEQHLEGWIPESSIRVRTVLQDINRGLSESFPLEELNNVVENYELMHWITVDRSDPNDPVITAVHPLFFEQSMLHRTERLGVRHDADEQRERLKREQEDLSATVAEMGRDPEAEPEELERVLLAKFQLVVVQTMPNLVAFGYWAFVRHMQDDRQQAAKASGGDESEAICFAAARAYLERKARQQETP